jgi:hypothetical protein
VTIRQNARLRTPGYVVSRLACLATAHGQVVVAQAGSQGSNGDRQLTSPRTGGEVSFECGQSSSRIVAFAWPPPSHMVCRP